MGDFKSFDIRCWSEDGLTFLWPEEETSKQNPANRPSWKSILISSATAAIVFFSPIGGGTGEAIASMSTLDWQTAPNQRLANVHSDANLPSDYWPKLVSALKIVPHLPEDDYSADPDSIV